MESAYFDHLLAHMERELREIRIVQMSLLLHRFVRVNPAAGSGGDEYDNPINLTIILIRYEIISSQSAGI